MDIVTSAALLIKGGRFFLTSNKYLLSLMVLGRMNFGLTQILVSCFICSSPGFHFIINRRRLEII